MRILICHGYLLRGTGSNQYVQSLSRALCKQGHHVLIMCQESDPSLDFVTTYMRESSSGSGPEMIWRRKTDYPGTCMVYQPDIGGLLPVYVMDSYTGFRVKEFTDLDDSELDWYVDRNRRALQRLVGQFIPDVMHANHAVMLPYIVRPIADEAGVQYYVSIHGSAIEYTVKKDRRYVEYGAEGLAGARSVLVPSEHTARQVMEVFGDIVDDLEDRIVGLPPGVDTETFNLAEHDLVESVDLLCEAVARRTEGVTVGDFRGKRGGEARLSSDGLDLGEEISRINALHPDWLPDADLPEALPAFAGAGGPFLMFLGKLLETKGIQCVLSALPLILRDHPDARLVIVGFGELRGMLELMLDALDSGDMSMLRKLCEFGNERYTLSPGSFDPVLQFMAEIEQSGSLAEYVRFCHGVELREAVLFTGYLTPEEHRYLLPHARAVLITSLAQEAFGLVATEAMAAGVAPIASYHSGLETALGPVREIWGADADILLLDSRERFVSGIAEACDLVLDMPDVELRAKGVEMRGVVKMRFSWDAVARALVELMESGIEPEEGGD
ncbi:MAG: glycosyltransferase family 4 protein [Candidatus Geothermincolia bacterium]